MPKYRRQDREVGLILEKHANRTGKEIYSSVYRIHPLYGKLLETNLVDIDRVLSKPWRWLQTVTLWLPNGDIISKDTELKTPTVLAEVDEYGWASLVELCNEYPDWVKMGCKSKLLGR